MTNIHTLIFRNQQPSWRQEGCWFRPPGLRGVPEQDTTYVNVWRYCKSFWMKAQYKCNLFTIHHRRTGVLGSGQEAGPEEALPVSQLVDQLQQVHTRSGRVLRQALPRVRAAAHQDQRDPAGGRGPGRDRAAGRKGTYGADCGAACYSMQREVVVHASIRTLDVLWFL